MTFHMRRVTKAAEQRQNRFRMATWAENQSKLMSFCDGNDVCNGALNDWLEARTIVPIRPAGGTLEAALLKRFSGSCRVQHQRAPNPQQAHDQLCGPVGTEPTVGHRAPWCNLFALRDGLSLLSCH